MAVSTSTVKTGVDEKTIGAIRALFAEAKSLYQPGGEYAKGLETQLERGQKKAVTGGMAGLASAGLANTSMMGGLAKKYEEEVAAPTRAASETQRLGALSSILASQASAEAGLAERTQTSQQYTPSIGPATAAFPKTQAQEPLQAPAQSQQSQSWQPVGIDYSSWGAPTISASPISTPSQPAKSTATPTLKNAGLYGPTPTGGNIDQGPAPAPSPVMTALSNEYFRYW